MKFVVLITIIIVSFYIVHQKWSLSNLSFCKGEGSTWRLKFIAFGRAILLLGSDDATTGRATLYKTCMLRMRTSVIWSRWQSTFRCVLHSHHHLWLLRQPTLMTSVASIQLVRCYDFVWSFVQAIIYNTFLLHMITFLVRVHSKQRHPHLTQADDVRDDSSSPF